MDCGKDYGVLQMKKILLVALLFLTACRQQVSVANTPSSSTAIAQSPAVVISESNKLTDETLKELLIKFRGILLFSYNADINYQDGYSDEDRDYHLVENYSGFEQLKNSVLSYTTEDIFNESLKLASFEKKDGKLYLSQPAMGLSSYSENPSWEKIDDTTVAVSGQTSDGVEDGHKYIIHFGEEDGIWKVTSYQYISAQE